MGGANRFSGRIGQSILQTGDGVPRGTPKWTKRNHTAAVKVSSVYPSLSFAPVSPLLDRLPVNFRADRPPSRLSRGVLGNPPFSPQEAVPPTSTSISGRRLQALVLPPSPPPPKSPPSSGPLTQRKSYQPTVSQTTTSPSGRTPPSRRYMMFRHTTSGCSEPRSVPTDARSQRVPRTRTSSSGGSGRQRRPRRIRGIMRREQDPSRR